jgi:hypothetical protein
LLSNFELSHKFFGWQGMHTTIKNDFDCTIYINSSTLYIPLHNLEEAIEILFGTREWSNTS